MTQRRLWTAVLFLAACGTPAALADTITTYDINFTGSGTVPTAGSFTYDSTVPSFSDFTVTWAGVVLNFTAAANAPSLTPPEPACLGAATGAAATFDLLSGDCDSPPTGSATDWTALQYTPNDNGGFDAFSFASSNLDTNAGILVFTEVFGPPNSTASGSGSWTISAVGQPSPVPEPNSVLLLAALFCASAFLARQRILAR